MGLILAKRFKIPYTVIKNDPIPGDAMTQQYGYGHNKKSLYLRQQDIKKGSRVLIVNYILASGEEVQAAR